MQQTADRYPNQDLTLAMPGYLLDYAALAARFGLVWVREALVELRTVARPNFFPDPGETRGMIEELMAKEKAAQRAANPWVPCESCMDGWVQYLTSDGRQTCVTRCACWLRWKAANQPEKTHSADGKAAGAGAA